MWKMIAQDICFLVVGCDCYIVTMWICCNQIPNSRSVVTFIIRDRPKLTDPISATATVLVPKLLKMSFGPNFAHTLARSQCPRAGTQSFPNNIYIFFFYLFFIFLLGRGAPSPDPSPPHPTNIPHAGTNSRATVRSWRYRSHFVLFYWSKICY